LIFTIEGWNEIPRQIQEVIESGDARLGVFPAELVVFATRVYFGTTLLLGGIFGLSLAHAVFVDLHCSTVTGT